jgi:hypothetical protein
MERTFFALSFADAEGFLGGLFIEASYPLEAVRRIVDLDLDPGGEIVGVKFTLSEAHPGFNPDRDCDRLLSLDDMVAMGLRPTNVKTGIEVQ